MRMTKTIRVRWLVLLCLIVLPLAVCGLSIKMGRNINFPKDFDPTKAEAILKVIRNERFQFVDGNYSHWPPDWGTRLSFTGDAAALSDFLSELRGISGIGLRLILYQGRDDLMRRDSAWQLDFSQARPGQLALWLNLNTTNIDFYKIVFPEWPATAQSVLSEGQGREVRERRRIIAEKSQSFDAKVGAGADNPKPGAPIDAENSLAEAISAFNEKAAADLTGKEQPPLTQDAVIAAIRWSLLEKEKLPVSAKTIQTLGRIVDARALPQGFELECLTGYEPNDRVAFTVWSVRLRIPREPNGTTCITIQEKMICSRLFGEEERKVIHKWQKKEQERGGIGSFERIQYAEERAKAAEIDRSKQK